MVMIKNKVYCVIGYDNHLMEGNVYEYEYTEDGAIILQVYDHFKIVDQNFLNSRIFYFNAYFPFHVSGVILL